MEWSDIEWVSKITGEEELEVLITPQQIVLYKNSEDARKSVKLFATFASEPLVELLRSDHCCMREYPFVQIELQNSHRSGVSSNLLLEKYKKQPRKKI